MDKFLRRSLAPLALAAACGDSGGASTTAGSAPTGVDPSASESSPTTGGAASPTTDPPAEASAEGSAGSTATDDPPDSDSGPAPCPAGDIVCDGATAQVCDGAGGFADETECDVACAPGLGCTDCVPGTSKCDGMEVLTCADDGEGYAPAGLCDPLQGLVCDPEVGACVGPCASLGGLSYIGCDYYAVTTQQYDLFYNDLNPFAIAVANAADSDAMVAVHLGDELVKQVSVPQGSVKIVELPWVAALTAGSGPTKHAKASAYRVRSNQPLTVYQFSPIDAAQSNDASLLLPVNTWSGNYVVAAWQHWADYNLPGFYSVVASRDNTIVRVQGPPGGTAVQAGGGIDDSGTGMALLNTGDVLTVVTAVGGDVTGSIVTADKPVEVIAGHECTQVPIGVVACDHLEEALFPFEALSNEYVVVPPVQVPNSALEKATYVRVVAAADDTHVTFEPDQGVDGTLALAGEFIEIPTTVEKFRVSSDRKVLVAQYMVGQEGGYGTSDPSMLQAVPSVQFRDQYLIYAQPAWQANFVDIIAPDGAAVMLDGAAVPPLTPIPGTGFSFAHVKLTNTNDGVHSLASSDRFGISVYGVVDYGSYWYPGGLDLRLIPPG